MDYLLFYSALFLLICSIVSCVFYNVEYWTNSLQLFKHLLEDEDYSFEVADVIAFSKIDEDGDYGERCWAKILCRQKTSREMRLFEIVMGNGLIGGVALFLSFSLVPFFWGLIGGFILACFMQYFYINLISFIARIIALKKARGIYLQYLDEED